MKVVKKVMLLAMCAMMAFSMMACNVRGVDGGFGDDGNYKPSEAGTKLHFWGWGDDVEGKVFNKLVDEFNATIGKANKIEAKYTQQPSSSYETATKLALSGNNSPDLVYAGDGSIKSWVESGWLEQLDAPENNYLEKSGGMDLDAMWSSAVNRYRYDVQNATANDDDPLWGLPKDISPTVIYYNKDFIKKANITIVSIPETEVREKFGQTIPDTNGKKYSFKGFDKTQMLFNNQIAMNWSETVELAKLIMAANAIEYGFFTEWWFNYGWGVGGDCMEYVTDENGKPYYKFTLGDETKNYIVKDDVTEPILVTGGNTYAAGEIVSYIDKANLTNEQKALCNELPSQRDALTEFVRLSTASNVTVDTVNGEALKGYQVAMTPKSVEGVKYNSYFYTGLCGMYTGGRYEVSTLRKMMTRYDWDVAPLPVYRTYNTDGTVKAHGVSAGHSGSMAISIAKASKNKNAAWMLLQYISGEKGQIAQSKEGFAIPNQKELAYDDEIFLQSSQKPSNSKIFIDAAQVQRPADWTYLKDGEWITIWAEKLNTDVRNGKMDLTKFFKDYTDKTQNKLYTYNGYTK